MFTARFSLQDAPERVTVSIAAEAVGLRVLVVDDDEETAADIARQLKSWGPLAEHVTDADAATRALLVAKDSLPFELILVDGGIGPAVVSSSSIDCAVSTRTWTRS